MDVVVPELPAPPPPVPIGFGWLAVGAVDLSPQPGAGARAGCLSPPWRGSRVGITCEAAREPAA